MVFHNNTPESILDAPSITRRWTVHYYAPNRAQRHHTTTPTGRLLTVPEANRPPATNEPYVKTKVRSQGQMYSAVA